jgi:hypothetical protein
MLPESPSHRTAKKSYHSISRAENPALIADGRQGLRLFENPSQKNAKEQPPHPTR